MNTKTTKSGLQSKTESYKAQQTRWDGLDRNSKFRFIHNGNRIVITNNGNVAKIDFHPNGTNITPNAKDAWDDKGDWQRKSFAVDGVEGCSYTKKLKIDSGEGRGKTEHRITITTYPIEDVGEGIKKVMFGYLQELDRRGPPPASSHTGEWH